MSKKDDDYNKQLHKDRWEAHHDAYIQWIIDKIEDPDYDEYPILIDSDKVVYPSGVTEVRVIQHLKAALKFMKVKAGVD